MTIFIEMIAMSCQREINRRLRKPCEPATDVTCGREWMRQSLHKNERKESGRRIDANHQKAVPVLRDVFPSVSVNVPADREERNDKGVSVSQNTCAKPQTRLWWIAIMLRDVFRTTTDPVLGPKSPDARENSWHV